jgi:hypothetical protein
MTDPRLAVAFAGVNGKYATFKIDNSTITYSATQVGGSASVGLAVTPSAADTVALAADGNPVLGKLLKVDADNYATVQIGGGMTLPGGSAASLTLGKKIVGAVNGSAAPGYIREVATGTAAELGLCRGFIVDAGTTTAVEVYLD